MYLLTNIFLGIFSVSYLSLIFLSFYHELVVIFDILWIKCLYITFFPPSLWLCISFLNFFLMRKNFDEISFFALFFIFRIFIIISKKSLPTTSLQHILFLSRSFIVFIFTSRSIIQLKIIFYIM